MPSTTTQMDAGRQEDERMISSQAKETPSQKEIRYSYDIMKPSDFEKALSMYDCIVVDVWAPWCKSCSHFSRRFESEIGLKYESMIQEKKLLLLKDNIENEESYHRTQDLHVVPTFYVYRRGRKKEVARFTGVEFNELLTFLESFFSSPESVNVSEMVSSTSSPSPLPYDSYLKKQMTYRDFH